MKREDRQPASPPQSGHAEQKGETPMNFGEKLQVLRKARGWSQEELAGQIHVSRQTLSKWESGGAVPDTENVIALSRLFGVSTDYLLLAEGEAAAAPVAAPAAKKWPTARRVWLVILIVALLAQIGLRIWGSVAMGKEAIYGGGQVYSEAVTALYYLNDRYNLTWLTLLVYGMTIAGFVGTVLYKPVREFLRGEVLGEEKG